MLLYRQFGDDEPQILNLTSRWPCLKAIFEGRVKVCQGLLRCNLFTHMSSAFPCGTVKVHSQTVRSRATAADLPRPTSNRTPPADISLHPTHAANRIQFWSRNPSCMQFKHKFLTHPNTRHAFAMVIGRRGMCHTPEWGLIRKHVPLTSAVHCLLLSECWSSSSGQPVLHVLGLWYFVSTWYQLWRSLGCSTMQV
jgi:hypothetical protein